jgi:hypothetical protein
MPTSGFSAFHDGDGDALVDAGLELLSEEECLALAALPPVGRVAISMGALPVVFPVNFCLVDRDVFFCTAPGAKLNAAMDGAVVAFEVDDFDPVGHRGWSVLMIGLAREVPPAELPTVSSLPLRPWAGGRRDHLVRIRTEFLSGRRIATEPVPWPPAAHDG